MKLTLLSKRKKLREVQKDQVMRLGKRQLEKLAKRGIMIQLLAST